MNVVDPLSCTICLESYNPRKDAVEALACSHVFHTDCVNKWINQYGKDFCPTCKTPVVCKMKPSCPAEDPTNFANLRKLLR